jgi:hypothetical protein
MRRYAGALLLILAATAQVPRHSIPAWRHLSSAGGGLPSPPASWKEETACLAADFDGDGRGDFIITERNQAPAILWYRNVDGRWRKQTIEREAVKIGAGGVVGDIDRDGDPDFVLGGRWDSNEIWWWENPHPRFDPGTPWPRHTIKRSGAGGHHDAALGDFDGDGAMELAAWNQSANQLLLFEVPAEPGASGEWISKRIYKHDGKDRAEGLVRADVNGDGRDDLAGGGMWFERVSSGDYKRHMIDPEHAVSRIAVAQLKRGGRPEVVLTPAEREGVVHWYEWDAQRWVKRPLLEATLSHVHTLETADIDGDGSLDVFLGEMGAWGPGGVHRNAKPRSWILYGDGRGGFTATLLSDEVPTHESKVIDVDGDRLPDIVSKPFMADTPRVDVWLQRRGQKERAVPR